MRQNFADQDSQPTIATATGSASDAATITIAADADNFWVLDWISWSFAAEPTSGKLEVKINDVVVWQVDITAAGPGHIEFCKPLYRETLNQSMVVTLTGTDADKKLNVRYR